MTGPLNIVAPELHAFTGRIDGFANTVVEMTPNDSLTDVATAVPGGAVASIVGALGDRLGRSAADLGEDLAGIAVKIRSATDAVENTDTGNAASFGGR